MKLSTATINNGPGFVLSKNTKEAKKINSELGNARTKQNGLSKLNKLLDQYDENIISENAGTWIRSLSQIIVQHHDTLTRQLASNNFKLLLSQSCQIPSVSREISSSLIPATLTSLLQGDKNDEPIISAVKSILINYPTSCGDLRSRIVKFMMPLMMSDVRTQKKSSIKCWSQVPFLGGGGSQKSTHSQQWQNQLDQTIQSLKFTFRLYMGEERKDVADPSIGSLALPFNPLPTTEPELSDALIKRLCMLSECLQSLMDVDFQVSVPIPINSIMSIIFDILDVIPLHLGNTSEMLHRASFLPLVQGNFLELLGKISKICKQNLCRYSSRINRTFSALLDQWRDKSPVYGKNKKHNFIRTQIYAAILNWIRNCGATCRFLCGPNHLNQSVLKHIINDVTPISNTLKVTNATIQTNSSRKAKKRRMNEASQELLHNTSCDKIRNPKVNVDLCSSTLEVILESLKTLGHRLSSSIHKILQESIIMILLQLQQGVILDPYTSCIGPRLLLYKVLLALVLSPAPSIAPPTALATKIFSLALSKERNPDIRSYCTEAITSLNVIIHPWRSSWHTCSVNTESDKKQSFDNLTPIIEPMNIEMNGFDDHEESEDENGENSNDNNAMSVESHGLNNSVETFQDVEENRVMKDVEGSLHGEEEGTSQDQSSETQKHVLESEDLPNDEQISRTLYNDNFTNNTVDSAGSSNEYIEQNDETINDELEVKTMSQSSNVDSSENMEEDTNVENRNEEDIENMEEVNKMLLDFVDASPDTDDDASG